MSQITKQRSPLIGLFGYSKLLNKVQSYLHHDFSMTFCASNQLHVGNYVIKDYLLQSINGANASVYFLFAYQVLPQKSSSRKSTSLIPSGQFAPIRSKEVANAESNDLLLLGGFTKISCRLFISFLSYYQAHFIRAKKQQALKH